METDFLTQKIISCAIEVHKNLGPGLLESSYESCLIYELAQSGVHIERQVLLPISYKGVKIDAGYRLDILLPGQLIIELKSVDRLAAIHTAQLITYLKLARIKTGLLMNFNVRFMKDGIKRVSI